MVQKTRRSPANQCTREPLRHNSNEIPELAKQYGRWRIMAIRPRAQCLSSGVRSGCAPVESSAGIGFAACAGKHYFVIGTKASKH